MSSDRDGDFGTVGATFTSGVGVGVSSIAIFVCASSTVDAFDFFPPVGFAPSNAPAV